jgi:catechol 2,3-dioxygenase-like lactoylglutathione lyase family enzyme
VTALVLSGVDHVVYVCHDVETVLDWWTGTLGLDAERVEQWRAGEVPFPSVRLSPTALVDLVPGPRSGENVAHVALDVALPVDELVAFVQERGLDLVDGPRALFGARGTGQGLYVRDPEGNVVELRTYLA